MLHKSKRIANRDLMDSYHSKRCVVCNKHGCDPAHIKSRGAGGPDEWWNLMPLCRQHHTEQGQIGIFTFLSKYDSVENYLVALGWEIGSGKIFHKGLVYKP